MTLRSPGPPAARPTPLPLAVCESQYVTRKMRVPGRGEAAKSPHNPFRFGDVAVGDHFTDREAELAALLGDLRSGQNVLVLAPRRFGKTSLMAEVMARLRREDVLVAYVDLLRVTSREQLAGYLATAVYEGLVPPVERALHRLGELFRELPLRPKVAINPDGSPSFEFGVGAEPQDVDATIDRLLALPGRVAAQRHRRAALVLDEFQEVIALDPGLPARLRSVFQFQAEVAHVYLGSRQHLLRQVFTEANQPLYNSARVVSLGPIPPQAFGPFIAARFRETGLEVTEPAIDRLLEITQGHPHDTQKLCSFTWALAATEGGPATPATVDAALRQVLQTETARYAELWDSLTPNQRRMLEALARTGAGVGVLSEAFRRRHRLGPYASAARALDALVERGLVERTGKDAVEVPDVFLRLWLRDDGVVHSDPGGVFE